MSYALAANRPTQAIFTLCLAILCGFAGICRGGEAVLIDIEGKEAWLYTPTDKPQPGKRYWLVVGVHGVGGTGKGACAADQWARQFDDVIVLGPTFTSPPRNPATTPAPTPTSTQAATQPAGASPSAAGPATRPAGMPRDSYQMSGPTHEAKLMALIAEIEKTWEIHPEIVLHGFSAGAQFAHRFAMHHPDRVAGVSAHSAGSWAKPEGNDAINPAGKGIPFAISCGEEDTGRGGPAGTPTRIEGAKLFAANLKAAGFTVDFKTWPGTKHEFAPGLMPMAKELLERVRAGNPEKPG